MNIREYLERSLFDQTDESTSTPLSIRLPNYLNNELDELSITLDKSKSFLLIEFIKAGIIETNNILEKKAMYPKIENQNDFSSSKYFMLNTSFNHDKSAHIEMLKIQEAAAFCSGWKEYICNLRTGDRVYLYQSGVGFIASGTVAGSLEKYEYKGKAEEKFSKKLEDFKTGFKAISAKEFKALTKKGANFRMVMVELSTTQANALDEEIAKRMGSAG